MHGCCSGTPAPVGLIAQFVEQYRHTAQVFGQRVVGQMRPRSRYSRSVASIQAAQEESNALRHKMIHKTGRNDAASALMHPQWKVAHEHRQVVSQWINTLNGPDGEPIAGIEFDSRHGDGLTLWALYENPGDPAISPSITPLANAPVDARDPALAEAMRLLGLVWSAWTSRSTDQSCCASRRSADEISTAYWALHTIKGDPAEYVYSSERNVPPTFVSEWLAQCAGS